MLADVGSEPSYDPIILRRVVEELASLILEANGGGKLVIPDLHEYYNSRVGHSKQRFGVGVKRAMRHGYKWKRDSKIGFFIKVENYKNTEEKEFSEEVKDPRGIFGRDPVFGLTYGRFTSKLEELLKRVPGFDKGKDFYEMGKFVEDHPEVDWTYYDDDASKFESSQRERLLRDVELALWKLILTEQDYDLLLACFETKMLKRGFTRLGAFFEFYALRCSGEVDTWVGNTLLNWVAHRYFEVVNGFPSRQFIVTGDDGTGAYPRSHSSEIQNTFPLFGFDCKLRFISDPTQLEFCSAKFIEYAPGKWMLFPDIAKLLRNIGVMKNVDFESSVGHFYYSLGYMYKIMFPGVEFFQRLSTFLMSLTKNPKVRFVSEELLRYVSPLYVEVFRDSKSFNNVHIDPRFVSVGLIMSYGISPSELAQIYDWFDNVTVDISNCDKRFNRKGSPAPVFTRVELDSVQKILETGIKSSVPEIQRYVRSMRDR